MKDMPVSYSRLLNRLERQEVRLLRGGFSWPPIQSGLEEKIPPKVRQTLEAAFYKAFQTVFGPGGVKLVEKTIPVERLNLEQRLWEKELTPKEERAVLRQMERGRRKGQIGEVFAAGTVPVPKGRLLDCWVLAFLISRCFWPCCCAASIRAHAGTASPMRATRSGPMCFCSSKGPWLRGRSGGA